MAKNPNADSCRTSLKEVLFCVKNLIFDKNNVTKHLLNLIILFLTINTLSLMKENWDLSGVFTSPAQAESALQKLQRECVAFCNRYQNKVKRLSPKRFAGCVKEYSELCAQKEKISSYAYLLHSTKLNDEEISVFYQNINDGIGECSKSLIFFTTEIVNADKLDIDALKQVLSVGDFAWLTNLLRFKPHYLPVEMEQVFADVSSVEDYWVRLYDETRAKMVFTVKGEQYNEGQVLRLQMSESPVTRRIAGETMVEQYEQHRALFTTIYNALVRSRQINFDWHRYEYPEHEANMSNNIDKDDLHNLVSTIVANHYNVPNRYYRLKAEMFKQGSIRYWDRNAPYPFAKETEKYSIEEARDIVLNAFAEFSEEFTLVAKRFFDENMIDYYPYSGKDSGAYCMEMPVGYLPMVFLNFGGTAKDVMTMAHELGHAVHEYLSKEQGELGRAKSCAQAETASIFAEQLVFQSLLEKENDARSKFTLLAGHVENMINTSFRQVAFHCFEHFAHEQRAKGELTAENLDNAWMDFMGSYLGKSVDISDIAPIWSSVPHFFHYSFYVYSYCFSSCVVNALYELYKSNTVENFADKYLQMLKMGGAENYREALAHFGINASNPAFWQEGINLVSKYIDELEKLAEEIVRN